MISLGHKVHYVSPLLQLRRFARPFSCQRANITMSSPRGPKLLNFPQEIVAQVIQKVGDRRDLSNTRLACKTLDTHAAKELFKEIFISPSEEPVSTWNSVSQDDVIRRIPRHAIIHTQPDIENHDGEREEIGEDFLNALAALSKFPNLDSVEICFTPECEGAEEEFNQEIVEDLEARVDMLTFIFQAIKDRAADEKNKRIRKLTIINLQNCPIPDFTSSDLFHDVMGELEELHLSITQEYNEHGPDHDYTKIELQTFPAHLCSDWLKPISANLRALSIYGRTDNWGPFPGYFDPSGISFPKLQTLALGYYTLAHDNDLDWVLAIKSLRKLILHNCMVASWMKIGIDEMGIWKVRTHDWTRISENVEGSWADEFAYAGKWSQFIDSIAGGLPNLVDFRFDGPSGYWASDDELQYGVKHRDDCRSSIFPRRYICFDHGILPTHWPEADSKGVMHSWMDEGTPVNMHTENLEADQKSLDRLLDGLKKTRI
jgi:hypothetical protein